MVFRPCSASHLVGVAKRCLLCLWSPNFIRMKAWFDPCEFAIQSKDTEVAAKSEPCLYIDAPGMARCLRKALFRFQPEKLQIRQETTVPNDRRNLVVSARIASL